MFQIFDCTGKPVGRPEGYAKHKTAQALTMRYGRIRTAIWETYHKTRSEKSTNLVYSIRWID